MLYAGILILGFALLVWGADHFVEGAAALAHKLGIPPLVVGLTVVALGTSAPELAVNITAGLKHANEIAIGNVLGSNIFNLLVVAGSSAVFCPLMVDRTLLRRDWPASILATVFLLYITISDLMISRIDGFALCILFIMIICLQVSSALRVKAQHIDLETLSLDEVRARRPKTIAINMIAGLTCIVVGGQVTVYGATELARLLGLSETIIGLTVVALGTSLPELVTSIAAARKGENDIALGNVIGSNLFNVLFILGVSSSISPIPVMATGIQDMFILVIISVALFIPAILSKFGRLIGLGCLAGYVGYTAFILIR